MIVERPRVGFVGTGWIGRARLQALLTSNLAEVTALCDPNPEALRLGSALAARAQQFPSFESLLESPLDAVVISSPSALHPAQTTRALRRGLSVFCQKPLACSASQALAIVQTAREVDRLLRVDLCYRHVASMKRTREVVRSGEIGQVFAAELVFHNAYGPDKTWARDLRLAGGGCLIDLGVHLIDAALFVLGPRPVLRAHSQLHSQGSWLALPPNRVEDFAAGSVQLADGTSLNIACSWQSSFGDHARIRAAFYGTHGGVAFENVGGSFYDFACERYRGAQRERLVEGPDDWSGRALITWLQELRESRGYRDCQELIEVARVLDALYGREPTSLHSPSDSAQHKAPARDLESAP